MCGVSEENDFGAISFFLKICSWSLHILHVLLNVDTHTHTHTQVVTV
jgi:hypothetical protein